MGKTGPLRLMVAAIRKSQHFHPWQMWADERSFAALPLIFLGYFMLLNSWGTSWVGYLAARIFFCLIIIAGVITIFSRRWLG